MPPSNSWVAPFFAGAMTTIVLSAILRGQGQGQEKQSSKGQNTKKPNGSRSAPKPKPGTLMDTPTLDNRILRKAEGALRLRTSRLIIVVERCTNDHNYSAILRTAEALGVQHVYIIAPQVCESTLKINRGKVDVTHDSVDSENLADKNVKLHRSSGQAVKLATAAEVQNRANHHLFAQRAVQWLEVQEFDTTKECIDKLREDGYHIWSTDLSQEAVTLDEEGLRDADDTLKERNLIPDKLAIVFGTEAVGCTAEILNASDKRVYLPLRGFADSLNLSVATALCVHQLFILDPTIIGAMPEEERINIRRQWYAKLATQRIQSKSAKASKRRLIATIQRFENMKANVENPNTPSHQQQIDKIAKIPQLKKELQQLEDDLFAKALTAVEDLVHNPPEPISDMRRADAHRTTYAGKGTKEKNGDAWAGMPATNYYRVEANTSSFFRDRVKDRVKDTTKDSTEEK